MSNIMQYTPSPVAADSKQDMLFVAVMIPMLMLFPAVLTGICAAGKRFFSTNTRSGQSR